MWLEAGLILGLVGLHTSRQQTRRADEDDSITEQLMHQLFGNSIRQSFPESTCQIEYMDIVGGDINDGRLSGQQAKSPRHCQKRCQDVLGCSFFSWDRFTGGCWLKRADGLRIPHPKMIIGPKFCTGTMTSNPHTPQPKEPCALTTTAQPCDFAAPYQTMSGQCNSITNPLWGAAHTPFSRLAASQYGPDNQPRGTGIELPNVRTVVHAFPEHDNKESRVSSMIMQFGQFLDHDISNTNFPEKRCCIHTDRPECFNILVPSSDLTYNQRHNFSSTCIDFARSMPACGASTREQVNTVSAFLDASQLYGNDDARAKSIRTLTGGRLVENTERAGHLPTKQQLSRISDHLDDRFDFVAGDNRVNEQPFLTSMHTLFLREHNRLAGILERELNTANDELIYQSARKLVIIELQNIIYKEFLPLLLGRRTADKYKLTIEPETTVYNPAANPSVLNEFATAAMRYGHSMINSLFKVITDKETFLRLRDLFNGKMFNGKHLMDIEPMLLGLLNQNAQKVDGSFADELTNHLFQEHSPKKQTKFGGDLVARNLQRGRDHGLADYNTYRKICNLQPLTSFQQIPAEIKPEIWQRFQSLYKNINEIDIYPAAIVETPADPDALLGPTFSCIIGLQFHNLKYGDRYFFSHRTSNLNYLSKYMKQMEERTLSDIICDNTYIKNVQKWSMESPSPTNPLQECRRPLQEVNSVDDSLDDLQQAPLDDEQTNSPRIGLELDPEALENTGSRQNPRFESSEGISSINPSLRNAGTLVNVPTPETADLEPTTSSGVLPPVQQPGNIPHTTNQGRVPKALDFSAQAPIPFLPGAQFRTPKTSFFDAILNQRSSNGGQFPAENKPVRFIQVFGEQDAIRNP